MSKENGLLDDKQRELEELVAGAALANIEESITEVIEGAMTSMKAAMGAGWYFRGPGFRYIVEKVANDAVKNAIAQAKREQNGG
jgi:hypothetical protein